MMPLQLESASKTTVEWTEDEPDLELEELKTERSAKLGKLMVDFSQPEILDFSKDELSQLVITVISLPRADVFLATEGPFRPHSTFGPNLPVEPRNMFSEYQGDPSPDITLRILYLMAQDLFEKDLLSKGFNKNEDLIYPWRAL